MKIAIDTSPIVYGTGVSRYTKNLIENLVNISKKDDFIFFGYSFRKKDKLDKLLLSIKSGNKNCQVKTFKIPPTAIEILFNRVRLLGVENFIGNVDVYHSSDWTQPKTKAFKVTTVHDLVPIIYPEISNQKVVRVHNKRLEIVKKEVDKVIVPSETTKNDLMKLGISGEKIRVIYEAPEKTYKPAVKSEINRVKNKYGIKNDYLLVIGTAERKNIKNIMLAFKNISKNDSFLVIVGQKPKNALKANNIIYTGFVKDEDMPALYSGAICLVYTSFYEGFGLPILEAYATKTPVVTSNLGSMKEIGEGGALLVDPNRPEDISEGINEVIKKRSYYVERSTKMLKKYSWEKTATETISVYRGK